MTDDYFVAEVSAFDSIKESHRRKDPRKKMRSGLSDPHVHSLPSNRINYDYLRNSVQGREKAPERLSKRIERG